MVPGFWNFLGLRWDVFWFWGRRAGIDWENNPQKMAVFFIQPMVLGLFLEVYEVWEGRVIRNSLFNIGWTPSAHMRRGVTRNPFSARKRVPDLQRRRGMGAGAHTMRPYEAGTRGGQGVKRSF